MSEKSILIDLINGYITKDQYEERVTEYRKASGTFQYDSKGYQEGKAFEQARIDQPRYEPFGPQSDGGDQTLPGVKEDNVGSPYGPNLTEQADDIIEELGINPDGLEGKSFKEAWIDNELERIIEEADDMGYQEEKLFREALVKGGTQAELDRLARSGVTWNDEEQQWVRDPNIKTSNTGDTGTSGPSTGGEGDCPPGYEWNEETQSCVPIKDPGSPSGGEGSVGDILGRGGSELWVDEVGNKYISFRIPNTDAYMTYTATEEQLGLFYSDVLREDGTTESFLRPIEQLITPDSDKWINSLGLGNIVEVEMDVIESEFGSIFESIVSNFEKVKKVRPWMEDNEMFSIWLEGIVEDREIADYEWEGTEWWKSHTKEQRDWMLLSQGADMGSLSADAQALLDNNKIRAKEILRQNGVSNPDEIISNGQSLTEWFGSQLSTGAMTELQWMNQAKAMGDPLSGIEVEESIQSFLTGSQVSPKSTQAGYAQAIELAERWLGPLYGNFSDADIDKYASMIRNAESPEIGVQQVEDSLKSVRKVMFSTDIYDENLTYDEIATPWRNFAFQMLGERVSETSSDWIDVLNANDQAQASKILTIHGMNNGNQKILDQVTDDMGSFLGSSPESKGILRGQST